MGKKYSDYTAETTALLTDLALISRTSDGAAGTKKITLEDLFNSIAAAIDKDIYVLGGMMLETQPGSAIIAGGVPTEDCVLTSADNRSCGKALIAPTNDTVFSLQKEGVEFGTMTILAGGSSPVFSIASDTSFTGGSDLLTVVNPATPDPTLRLFFFSIWGRR